MANFKRHDPVQDPLIWYREMVRYGLEEGVAPGLREKRGRLETAALSALQNRQLADLDESVLLIITDLELEYPPLDLLTDSHDQPLAHWWWHLGKLRDGTYPAQLLPDHLRVIYQPAPERLAA
jgi:hypothetical protein